jgi:hypothetical protein
MSGYGSNTPNIPAGSQFDPHAPWNATGAAEEEERTPTFQDRFNAGLDRLLKLLDDDDGEGCCTACGEPLDENGKCPFDDTEVSA